MCVCVCACVRACGRACVRVCVWVRVCVYSLTQHAMFTVRSHIVKLFFNEKLKK